MDKSFESFWMSKKKRQAKQKLSKTFTRSDCVRAFIRIDYKMINAFKIFTDTLEEYLNDQQRKRNKRKQKSAKIEMIGANSKKKGKFVLQPNESTVLKNVQSFLCQNCPRQFTSNHGLLVHRGKLHKKKKSIKSLSWIQWFPIMFKMFSFCIMFFQHA